MPRRFPSPIVAALVLALGASPLAAAPLTPESKAVYDKAVTEYDLGHYKDALADFEKVYTAQHVPALLFNIAQCHRLLGELKEAAAVYRSFISRDPQSGRADQARALLDQAGGGAGQAGRGAVAQGAGAATRAGAGHHHDPGAAARDRGASSGRAAHAGPRDRARRGARFRAAASGVDAALGRVRAVQAPPPGRACLPGSPPAAPRSRPASAWRSGPGLPLPNRACPIRCTAAPRCRACNFKRPPMPTGPTPSLSPAAPWPRSPSPVLY